MNILYLISLTFSQALIGYAIATRLNMRLSKLQLLTISLIIGMGVVSAIPAVLQILYVPLTGISIFSCIAAVTIIFSLLVFNRLMRIDIRELTKHKIELYEWPWLMVMILLVLLAAGNGLLIPPTPRDLLSGPEPIAHFALTEHTFINSVYQQDMPANNGPFKSLYIPSLQLIYKLIGFPFGKIWVVILSTSFLVFLYSTIRGIIHPVLTGATVLLFVFVPEVYAYTYLVLYDYSNMVFFFLSLYFLRDYVIEGNRKAMVLSTLFMAIATYIRPETLILAAMVAMFVFIATLVKKNYGIKHMLPVMIFGAACLFTYLVTSYLYLNYYLPVHYDVAGDVNNNPGDISPLIDRLKEITFTLIYSGWGLVHYGYIFCIGTILFIVELVICRKVSKEAAYWLGMLLLTYLGIAIIGYLLPLADLLNTTKRSLFKIIPLLLMYMAYNGWIQQLSAKLYRVHGPPARIQRGGRPSAGQVKDKKRKK